MRVERLPAFLFAAGFLVLLGTLGCSSDDSGGTPSTVVDSGEDRRRTQPDQGQEDQQTADVSTDLSPRDVGDPGSDPAVTGEDLGAAEDTPAETTEDPTVDPADTGAGDTGETDASDPWEGRPLGQCAVNDDCPEVDGFASCVRTRPGGVCSCRKSDGGCPHTSYCHDEFPSCVEDCSTAGSQEDCPPGLVCSLTLLCKQLDCVGGECPVPLFGCDDSNRCARIECDGETICPDHTTCVAGYCVEDRLLD